MRWLTLLAMVGCNNGGDEPVWEQSGCDPLDEAVCALPFPSSYFEADDAGTATGRRVAFSASSLPVNRDGVQMDPRFLNEKDGWSIHSPMLTWFGNVSLDGVISHVDLDAYTAADAKTVVIDTSTGERVPHWVELDMTADKEEERLLILRPAVPLEYDTTYVVGIRGLTLAAGGEVPVSTAFTALRDATDTEDGDIEFRRRHFDDVVFPALEAEGFARGELQLAWDFHTISQDSSIGRVLHVRDDALERFTADGIPYTLEVEDHDCAGSTIARTIEGVMTVPLYTETDAPGTFLTRDGDGLPYANGTGEAHFVVRIPCSVANDPGPRRFLQYGHGLLGDRGEARTGWLSAFANEHEYVVVATDWTGMSEEDVPSITIMIVNDPTDFAFIPERSVQGFVHQLALTHLVQGALADDDALKFDDVSVIDPTRPSYYGNSQGAILGGAFLALSPEIHRGVLGVGGLPYALLLPRSHDFDPFFLIFKEKYSDHRTRMFMITGLLQQMWDIGEGAGFAHVMNRDPVDGYPAKEVLMQVGIGDAQVTTLGAHIAARAWGASTVAPQTRPVWGVEEAQPGFTGSALVEWEYDDVPDEPVQSIPPSADHDPHECPRRNPAGQLQIVDFLETGVVNQYCDGRCTDTQATCR